MIRALNDSLVHDDSACDDVRFAAPQQNLSGRPGRVGRPTKAGNDWEDFI
jgi:hypothetical protein